MKFKAFTSALVLKTLNEKVLSRVKINFSIVSIKIIFTSQVYSFRSYTLPIFFMMTKIKPVCDYYLYQFEAEILIVRIRSIINFNFLFVLPAQKLTKSTGTESLNRYHIRCLTKNNINTTSLLNLLLFF